MRARQRDPFRRWGLPSEYCRRCGDCCSDQPLYRCMPLAVAPCEIHEITETSALDCLVRKRNVRHGSRTARGKLLKSCLDELRAKPEHLQKGAHLLKIMERALAGDGGLFSFSAVRHKSDAESRAGAADGAMNANCTFICHVLCSSPLGCLPFHFRDIDALVGHFIERGQFAQLGDDLNHLVDDVVDFLLRIEAAEADSN